MKKISILFLATLAICCAHTIRAKVESIKTISEFEELKEKGCPMVVKFFTPWCQACNMVASSFHKVSDDPHFSHIKFVTVNADHAVELADKKNIKEVPTFLFIANNKVKSRTVGIKNPEKFEEFLIERINRKLPAKKKDHIEGVWDNIMGTFNKISSWTWDLSSRMFSAIKGLFGL